MRSDFNPVRIVDLDKVEETVRELNEKDFKVICAQVIPARSMNTGSDGLPFHSPDRVLIIAEYYKPPSVAPQVKYVK